MLVQMGGYEKPNLKIRLSKKEANKTPISKGRILVLATHHHHHKYTLNLRFLLSFSICNKHIVKHYGFIFAVSYFKI